MARFQILRSSVNHQYYFRLLANSGKPILVSEGYSNKENCRNGIASVRVRAPYESTYQRIDNGGNCRFSMIAPNGEIIIRSSEGYLQRSERESAIDIVKREASVAPIDVLV